MTNEGISDVYNSYKLQLKGYHKRQFNLFEKKKIITLKCKSSVLLLPLAKVNVYKWMIINGIQKLLIDKHNCIQKKYYDFRKTTIDKNKKRGKMETHMKTPTLIIGLSKIAKKNV